MYPKLFSIGNFDIYAYGFITMVAALISLLYMSYVAKRDFNIEGYKIQTLAVLIIVSAVFGGKLFFFFEDPSFYFQSFSNLTKNFRTGFVFYGSLFFVIPVTIWYFKKEKWPLWPMMDYLAIMACILHGMGRLGCFLAGCCYGIPTDLPWGVTFSDSLSRAKPLHVPLHPTQLYSAGLIFSILVFLLMLKRHKRFDGQLFFIYIILYTAGRGIIEIFRGDEARGFVFDTIISHSQLISILLITVAVWFYVRFRKKANL